MHDFRVVAPAEFEAITPGVVRALNQLAGATVSLGTSEQIDPLSPASANQVYLVPVELLDTSIWSSLRTKLAAANRYFVVFGTGLSTPAIVQACRDGAFDVLDLNDAPARWRTVPAKAREAQGLWWTLYGDARGGTDPQQLIGRSQPMKALRLAIERLGPTPASVLILGESGTGKERVAEALHAANGSGEFVAFNCAAVPAQLLEAELFGVKKGAFTGAGADRPGLVEQAHGGTLFLDEIGEMETAVQPKLLRFLETRTARRLGSNENYHVDLRIIAATNRNLDTGMGDGSFRPDLYYRLAEITLKLAPLRQRLDDIPLLARHFLDGASSRFGKFFDAIEPELIVLFQSHNWPGNVRELKSAIDRLVLMHDGPVLRSGWWEAPETTVPPNPSPASPFPHAAGSASFPAGPPAPARIVRTRRDRLNRARELVAENSLNLTEIAAELGVHPSTLFRWRQAGKL